MTQATAAAGWLEPILARAGQIREFEAFPGVDELTAFLDELVERYPEIISARRIGTSRLGEPLTSYRIEGGSGSALVYAGVHPNEPIGFCTVMQLAAELCADEEFRTGLDCTWHIVPNVDPDGTRLNEGWYAGPFDRVHYARHFYRPAPGEQVEWAFPLDYKGAYFDAVIPESLALMRLIDEVRPDIAVSLHNSELGGVYYYLSRDVPGLIDALAAIADHAGLPLHLGEPESPVAVPLGPAVFTMISAESLHDYRAELGLPVRKADAGSSSSAYAERHGTVSLVAELPYWTHAAADDLTPTQLPYVELLEEVGTELVAQMTELSEIYTAARPHLSNTSQLVRATESFLPFLTRLAQGDLARAAGIAPERLSTVAEAFSLRDRNRLFRLRYGGMVLRAIEGEVARGAAPAVLHRLQKQLRELYGSWQQEAAALEDDLNRVPISRLVGVQYAATLALLRTVREEG
jgi:hypothetical protein